MFPIGATIDNLLDFQPKTPAENLAFQFAVFEILSKRQKNLQKRITVSQYAKNLAKKSALSKVCLEDRRADPAAAKRSCHRPLTASGREYVQLRR